MGYHNNTVSAMHVARLTFRWISSSQMHEIMRRMSACISRSTRLFAASVEDCSSSIFNTPIYRHNLYMYLSRLNGDAIYHRGNLPSRSGIAPCSWRSWCITSSPPLHMLSNSRREYLNWESLVPHPPSPWKLLPWPLNFSAYSYKLAEYYTLHW